MTNDRKGARTPRRWSIGGTQLFKSALIRHHPVEGDDQPTVSLGISERWSRSFFWSERAREFWKLSERWWWWYSGLCRELCSSDPEAARCLLYRVAQRYVYPFSQVTASGRIIEIDQLSTVDEKALNYCTQTYELRVKWMCTVYERVCDNDLNRMQQLSKQLGQFPGELIKEIEYRVPKTRHIESINGTVLFLYAPYVYFTNWATILLNI